MAYQTTNLLYRTRHILRKPGDIPVGAVGGSLQVPRIVELILHVTLCQTKHFVHIQTLNSPCIYSVHLLLLLSLLLFSEVCRWSLVSSCPTPGDVCSQHLPHLLPTLTLCPHIELPPTRNHRCCEKTQNLDGFTRSPIKLSRATVTICNRNNRWMEDREVRGGQGTPKTEDYYQEKNLIMACSTYLYEKCSQ